MISWVRRRLDRSLAWHSGFSGRHWDITGWDRLTCWAGRRYVSSWRARRALLPGPQTTGGFISNDEDLVPQGKIWSAIFWIRPSSRFFASKTNRCGKWPRLSVSFIPEFSGKMLGIDSRARVLPIFSIMLCTTSVSYEDSTNPRIKQNSKNNA